MGWGRHLVLSAKVALAAALAWLVVQPFDGVADRFDYYAPLGAVIAVTSTVAGSVRESMQGLLAILAGAAIALVVQPLAVPVVVDLGLTIGLGTAVSGWRAFGEKASYVPVSGLFTLILGGGQPLEYALAYLGLTAAGVVAGIALNAAFPPLALRPMSEAIERLRTLLGTQLGDLADGLDQYEPLTLEQWQERQQALRPDMEEMQAIVAHTARARRANWRARRWSQVADEQYQQARALQQVTLLIEDIAALVVEQERAELTRVALGPAVRPAAARTLRALTAVLQSVQGHTAAVAELHRADAELSELVRAIRDERHRSATDMFAAGTVVTGVRRAIASLVPAEERENIPSQW